MPHGATRGDGIYMADNLPASLGYANTHSHHGNWPEAAVAGGAITAVVAICEVIDRCVNVAVVSLLLLLLLPLLLLLLVYRSMSVLTPRDSRESTATPALTRLANCAVVVSLSLSNITEESTSGDAVAQGTTSFRTRSAWPPGARVERPPPRRNALVVSPATSAHRKVFLLQLRMPPGEPPCGLMELPHHARSIQSHLTITQQERDTSSLTHTRFPPPSPRLLVRPHAMFSIQHEHEDSCLSIPRDPAAGCKPAISQSTCGDEVGGVHVW